MSKSTLRHTCNFVLKFTRALENEINLAKEKKKEI